MADIVIDDQGITPEIARGQLALYLNAEAVVLTGQSYEIAGRKLTRADLEDIQNGIKLWNDRLATLISSGASLGRRRTMIPFG